EKLVDLGGDPGVAQHATAVVIEYEDQGVLGTRLRTVGPACEHADEFVDVAETITVDIDGHGCHRTQLGGPVGDLQTAFTECEYTLFGERALLVGGAQGGDRGQDAEPGRFAGGGGVRDQTLAEQAIDVETWDLVAPPGPQH